MALLALETRLESVNGLKVTRATAVPRCSVLITTSTQKQKTRKINLLSDIWAPCRVRRRSGDRPPFALIALAT
jgi:hypothetical protein